MSDNLSQNPPKYCGSCGKKLLEGATFCAYCGARTPALSSFESTEEPSLKFQPSIKPTSNQYSQPYYSQKTIADPPLPFFEHFRGVLLQPKSEMAQIIKRPNLRQPFLIVLINGVLISIALVILFSKINIIFTPEFYTSWGFSEDILAGINIEDYIKLTFLLSMPLNMLISWFIATLILWGVLSLFASNIPSHERNFRTIMTISGWATLPQFLGGILAILNNLIFVPNNITIQVNSISEMTAITSAGSVNPPFDLIFLVTDFIFLILTAVLIYFAIKSIRPEGNQAVFVTILYTIIWFFVPVLLSLFLF